MAAGRKPRVWSVSDVAELLGFSHQRAKRLLKRIDAKHGGRLLMPSAGTNRCFTFYPATLAKLEPAMFEPVEDMTARVDEVEEQVAELLAMVKRVATQVGANTRGIEALKAASRRVA